MAQQVGQQSNGNEPLPCSKDCPSRPLMDEGLVQGIGQGLLVVTNLTVGPHLIGTPWMPHLGGAIVVFEDVGEAPYRVDRC